MDNSRDYTEILAREAEVNAGIWSKKKQPLSQGKIVSSGLIPIKLCKLFTQPNMFQASHNRNFPFDVAELGGMYSGKIYLIGTENGVGVRNAGHIEMQVAQR